jgi:hypothetical protein
VALAIVNLALEGRKDEAIAKMNAECRPLLSELVQSASSYLALIKKEGDADVSAAEQASQASRNVLIASSLLAVAWRSLSPSSSRAPSCVPSIAPSKWRRPSPAATCARTSTPRARTRPAGC